MKANLDRFMINTVKHAYDQGLYVEWYHGGQTLYKYSLTQNIFKILKLDGNGWRECCGYGVDSVVVNGYDSTLIIRTDNRMEFRFDAIEPEGSIDEEESE